MKAKQLNIFGELEDIEFGIPPAAKKTRKEKFEDYEAFVAKFDKNAPKTTDDCYTPQAIYDAVLEWLGERVDLKGRSIVRPFYPGGDYVNYEYSKNCVVVDNPPFSMIASICRFYLANNINYFLFAPGLTLFSLILKGNCDVVIKTAIKYHNGANVATGFKTNLFNDLSVLLAPSLDKKIAAASPQPKKTVKMPFNVISSALLRKAVGVEDIEIKPKDLVYINKLDAGVKIYGGGYFVSTRLAKRSWRADFDNDGRYELSAREKDIIKKLDKDEEESETS